MRKIMILVLVTALCVMSPASYVQDNGAEYNEIVIVKAPDAERKTHNPYQTEYEQMLYPTVRITAGFSTGSGVVFTTKSTKDTKNTIYILTACHVVEDENTVDIELYDSSIITGTVVITDTDKDLAIIKPQIDTVHTDKIYTGKLADKNYTPYLFTPVWAVGCSLRLPPRPSFGHITAITLSLPSPLEGEGKGEGASYWEISAPILPGNSGGPVYDARTYEVIGIAVWVNTYQCQLITTMAGIVPINRIYEFLEHNKYARSEHRKP